MHDVETHPSLLKALQQRLYRHRLFLALSGFVVAVVLLTYRTVSVLNTPGVPTDGEFGLSDFRDAIYYPVLAFLQGNNPYDTATYTQQYPVNLHFPLYSPLTLLIHLPFGLLPYELSELIYYVLTILLYLLVAYVALNACGKKAEPWQVFMVAALILISRPGHNNLVLGQCTMQVVLFSLLALQYAKPKPVRSGIFLALSTFKPTFGVPIFLLMLCRGNFRACSAALVFGTVTTLTVVAVLASNVGGIQPLVDVIADNNAVHESARGNNPLLSYSRIDMIALIGRFLGWIPPWPAALAIGLAVLCIGAIAVARQASAESDHGPAGLSGAAIFLTSLLLVYHQEYGAMLLVPMFIAVVSRQGEVWSVLRPIPRGILIGCLTLLATNYLATKTAIAALNLTGAPWTIVASLNGLAVAIMFVTCIYLIFRGRTAVSPVETPP